MCTESCINFAWLEIPNHVFSSKTVASRADFLTSQVSHYLQARVNNRINPIRKVSRWAFQPLLEVEPRWSIQGDCVSVELIRHNNKIPIRSELISNKLRVDEGMANDIRKKENTVGRISMLWIREIRLNCNALSMMNR